MLVFRVVAVLAGLGAAIPVGVAGAQTQRELRGVAIDARTTGPLRDGQFILTSGRDTLGAARSDSAGRFRIVAAAAGSAILHVRRLGYRADSILVMVGDSAILRLALVPATVATLPKVLVSDSAALSAFERRTRRNAGGTFIRLADIERLKPVHTTDLLRRVPGISLDDSAGVMRVVSQRSLRRTSPTTRKVTIAGDSVRLPPVDGVRCAVKVVVDGHMMDDGFSVNDVRPADIAAIEMYVGAATIPVEFSTVQRNAPCGIIMLWTRRGRDR